MISTEIRGRSSVGRALAWHARGREFDSLRLHLQKTSLVMNQWRFLMD